MINAGKISGTRREDILKFVDVERSQGMHLEKICEILLISVRRLRRWQYGFDQRGHFQDMRRGPQLPHNRLTDRETCQMVSMGVDERYSALSHRELAVRAQDECRVYVSKSTFFRVFSRLGLIGRQSSGKPRQSRMKPKIREIAACPNRVWSWDFTYVWIGTGWIYLICILDVFSRRLMSWQVLSSMTDDLAIELWSHTLVQYNLDDPAARPVELWSFSDHGSQMTSGDTKAFFKVMGIPMVYSRYQVPEDNAIHESFHKTLKHDKNLGYHFWKVSSAKELQDYMTAFEPYYNSKRTHSALGDVTPDAQYFGQASKIIQKRRRAWQAAIRQRLSTNRKIQEKEKAA